MSDEQLEEFPLAPELEVRLVPVGLIRRYTDNPRRNSRAVAKVRASIDEFGWRQPIVVDEKLVIIAGDTRFLAALERQDERVPVHIARDLTADQARAYRIADNRTAEEAEWNDELLASELTKLLEANYNLALTGLETSEVDKLLGELEAPQLEELEPKPLPTMTWVLVGIPTVRYIEIAEEVERIALTPDVFCEVTANSDDQASAHRKAAKLNKGETTRGN